MTAIAAAGSSLDTVRDALQASGALTRTRGAQSFMASCPLHDDASPSLSVTWKPRPHNRGGAVLLHCFSCQAPAPDITAAVGLSMADLFDDAPGLSPRPPRARRPHPAKPAPAPLPPRITTPARRVEHRWRRTRVYTYTTAQGTPVQQVIRSECCCDGSLHKRFQQRYRHGRQWVYRKPADFTPVLYRAGVLQQAAASGRPVWITEGEKDADTLTALGELATTNAQGAGSFPDELAAQFQGLSVIIAADRDLAGYQRAISLHDTLQHVAAAVTVVLPAVTSDKADVTDHVTAQLWRPDDACGGLIPATRTDLVALHAAAEAAAAAGRAHTALAEAAAHHRQRGDHTTIARWLTEAGHQRHAVRSQLRKLQRHHQQHPSPLSLAAQRSTAELIERLHHSHRQTYEIIHRPTQLEKTA